MDYYLLLLLNYYNLKQVKQFLLNKDHNLIINAAAYTQVDQAEKEKNKAIILNTKFPKLLSEIGYNNVIDLTYENIYNNLNYEMYKNDIKIIKKAKYNICFGIGGQFCSSLVFGKSTILYCMNNIDKFDVKDKIIINRGYSNIEIPKFQDEYFDIIYIDGNHESEYVL